MILLGMALVVAACGDDDATEPSGTEATTAASTATESTTETTTVTETTTAVVETTMASAVTGPEAFIAAAVDYVGEYTGEWNNTTFGSTGAMFITVQEASTEFNFVLVEIDLDGNVFGAADPDAFVIEIFVDNGTLLVGFSEFLGDTSFEIDEAGNFVVTADPQTLGLPLEIVGSLVDGGFGGSYTIPGLAEGTWNVAPAG